MPHAKKGSMRAIAVCLVQDAGAVNKQRAFEMSRRTDLDECSFTFQTRSRCGRSCAAAAKSRRCSGIPHTSAIALQPASSTHAFAHFLDRCPSNFVRFVDGGGLLVDIRDGQEKDEVAVVVKPSSPTPDRTPAYAIDARLDAVNGGHARSHVPHVASGRGEALCESLISRILRSA